MNVILNEWPSLPIVLLPQPHRSLPSLMIKYYTLTFSFAVLWLHFYLTFSILSNWLVTVPDERKNLKLYPILSPDGWFVFLSRPNTVLRCGVMAFSEVWQGGSSCSIVLSADWGGGGNVISDWSMARVGSKFDVWRAQGIAQSACVCVTLCVCRAEMKEVGVVAHVLILHHHSILCVTYNTCLQAYISVFFLFAETLHVILRLYHSLRLVLMCWYLIWHPSPLPHNPIQPEGNGNFTASPFSLFIAFSSRALIQRVSVHHNAWMNVQRCFVSSPQAPKPIWWVGRQIHYTLHAILKFLQHIAAELGSSAFVAVGEKKLYYFDLWLLDIICCDLIWWSMSTPAILYLCLPYCCLWYNRQFSFPISVQENLCSGLILLMLKSDYGL